MPGLVAVSQFGAYAVDDVVLGLNESLQIKGIRHGFWLYDVRWSMAHTIESTPDVPRQRLTMTPLPPRLRAQFASRSARRETPRAEHSDGTHSRSALPARRSPPPKSRR